MTGVLDIALEFIAGIGEYIDKRRKKYGKK